LQAPRIFLDALAEEGLGELADADQLEFHWAVAERSQ
jgi:hypothetical protein